MSGWKERIQQAFIVVHNDVRNAEEVRASREMLAEIEKPVEPPLQDIRRHIEEQFNHARQTHATPVQVEQSSPLKIKTEYGQQEERVFHTRARYFSHAALRSVHINPHWVLQRGVHQCFAVEAPCESASELFEQALKQLSEE
jgi:hypothetical protein